MFKKAYHIAVVVVFVGLVFIPWSEFFSADVSLLHRLEAPSLSHPLGTDQLGRDLLVRLSSAVQQAVLPLWGMLIVGYFLGGLFAVLVLGFGESSFARMIHGSIKSLFWLVLSVPLGVLAFSFAVLFEQASVYAIGTAIMIVAAGQCFAQIDTAYLRDHHLGYWQVHKTIGGTRLSRIVSYGLGSHWRDDILRSLGFLLKVSVAIEASVSYLGFGVQEPRASFGNILASHYNLYLRGEWSSLTIIALALFCCAEFPVALWWLMPRAAQRRR